MDAPQRLVDWPWVTVEVECSLCPGRGRYRLARLAERLGCEFALGELLRVVSASCTIPGHDERIRQYGARCGVRYRVPRGDPHLGELPAREVSADEPPLKPRPKRRGLEGPLPTVGDALAKGPRGVRVSCLAGRADGWRCHHHGIVDLAVLELPPDLPYAHIPSRRVLRCSRCGSRDIGVMPDWPSPQEAQARRMSGDGTPVRTLNGIAMLLGGAAHRGRCYAGAHSPAVRPSGQDRRRDDVLPRTMALVGGQHVAP